MAGNDYVAPSWVIAFYAGAILGIGIGIGAFIVWVM